MIGKQIKGRSFRGVLNYLEQSEGAKIIAGNMSGRNAIELSKEFRLSRQLNPEVERAVYHASLSLAPGEHLDNDTWNEITSKYLKGMGFDSNQYVVYRHSNTDHDHVHIVASRIRLDNSKVVHDGWDYVRSENLIRELEKEYGLQPAPPSYEKKESKLSAGQFKRMEREQAEYEAGERNSPPERPVKEQLQTTINEAIKSSDSMPELIKNLLADNVSVRCEFTRTGKPKGISYGMSGIAFSGTKLGKGYTFPGLQKYESIKYNPKTDKELIINMMQYAQTAKKIEASELDKIVPNNIIQQNTQQQLNQREVERFALILKQAWRCIGRPKFIETNSYCFEHVENQLKITRPNGELVADLSFDKQHKPVFNIKEGDKENFEEMSEIVKEFEREKAEEERQLKRERGFGFSL